MGWGIEIGTETVAETLDRTDRETETETETETERGMAMLDWVETAVHLHCSGWHLTHPMTAEAAMRRGTSQQQRGEE